MDYIIGVDGGGTKTAATAYSLDDAEISAGRSGFGNLLLDFNTAVGNIKTAITQCLDGIKAREIRGKCAGIYLGIAGSEVRDNTVMLEHLLHAEFQSPVRAFHDAELSHAALFKGADGIIAISGTGSVAFGKYTGKKAWTGGWGHVFGDEGSGYDIAMRAFKRAALEQDAGLSESALTRGILQKLGFERTADLKGFIALAETAEIAAFAPLVAELAKTGEEHSAKILKDAGCALGVMMERLYMKLGVSGPVDIGVTGSILMKTELVRESFLEYLNTKLDEFTFVMEDISPTSGACTLHRIKEAL